MEQGKCKVCVTGGAGYIASALIKKLLSEGHIVHATLRDLDDHSKVDVLKSFDGADTRLRLFKADIYRAEEFEEAILGCKFVFHVATPLLHSDGHKYKNRVEATVDSAKRIASLCVRSGTVRRLIYTASVMAASPMKDGSSTYKEYMDETCWTTPANFSIPYTSDFLEEYVEAKTLAERELLCSGNGKMEVVTLACGLVGGQTLMPHTSGSIKTILGFLTNDEFDYSALKFLENLLAKVPLSHIEDITNSLVFCMKEQTKSTWKVLRETQNGEAFCSRKGVSSIDMIGVWFLMIASDVQLQMETLGFPNFYFRHVHVVKSARCYVSNFSI